MILTLLPGTCSCAISEKSCLPTGPVPTLAGACMASPPPAAEPELMAPTRIRTVTAPLVGIQYVCGLLLGRMSLVIQSPWSMCHTGHDRHCELLSMVCASN